MATLRNHPGFWLRDDAAAAFDRAEADHGVFRVNSAGRHVWEQQQLIDRWNRGGAANRPPYLYEPANPPESSNHVANGGVAVDLGDWRRFAQICEQYGFRHTYPGSDPVHFDYVGGGSGGGSGGYNQDVANRQGFLISRGFNLGPSGADGIAGPMYRAAVQQYQTFLRSYGYSGDIDGDWGDGTQAAHELFQAYLASGNDTLRNQQAFLISRGYDLGGTGADGIWGPKTEAAIKLYQQHLKTYHGYSGDIDGQWGPGTQAAHELFVASLATPPSDIPAFPLSPSQWFGPEAGGDNSISGWHSNPVGHPGLKTFQQRMKDRGWPITVDGIYGPMGASTPQGNTAEVVVAFQKEKGLTADGLIGPATWDAAWKTPITPENPIPGNPDPTNPTQPEIPDDELAATPNLVTPMHANFPSWIRFEVVLDPESQSANHNLEAAEYYGVPYNPIESHTHWWGEPGKAGTHDGNVNHLKNTKDLSVNFVVSEGRVTLMVPINKIALTTGRRNPYAWKSENDPALSEKQYKTMGYLHYIVEKLNPVLLNEPIRLHKEFQNTSCSEINKAKVREYAEAFRTGKLDPATGQAPVVIPPVDPEEPEVPPVNGDSILVKKSYIKGLANEFRSLAAELDGLAK